jgi:glucose/arabinose dehydrogenase
MANSPPRCNIRSRGSITKIPIEKIYHAPHGSWDRQQFSGYKVVFVPFSGGHPNGKAVDIVTGFLNADGEARGRQWESRSTRQGPY